MSNDNYSRYRKHFSESAFGKKLSKVNAKIREKAMLLYLVFKEPSTPFGVKVLIVSVLGYLICPMDVVPDVLPIIGYADDLAAILSLLVSIERYVTAEMRQKARQ